MELKLIHTADIHFDTPFSGLLKPESAAIRRQDIKNVFSEIVAQAQNKDMLLISGDLFDGKRVSRTTLEFLKREFAKIPQVKVFIAAGNHDYFCDDSVYETFDFGENVHIFSKEPERVETEFADVYGMSFSSTNEERQMLLQFRAVNPNKLNILVLHGNLAGEGYNPISLTDLKNCGMDYVALGHIHKRSDVKCVGSVCYAYPGCPEGRGFDETGEKGVLSVSVQKGNVSAEFIKTCVRQYLDITVDVTDCESTEDVLAKINAVHRGNEHLYRIRLVGNSGFPIEAEVLQDAVSAFEADVRNETVPVVNFDELQTSFTLKGLFTKFALEEKEQLSEEAFSSAFQAGWSLIEKEERNDH